MSQPPDYITPFAQAAQLPTPDIGGSFLQGIHQSLQQRFGMAQMQVQMAQQQQALSAQQAALADPTPANILKWGIADPSHYEAVKSSHDTMTSDAQKQDVQDAASIYGYLGAGDTDGASKILQQRVDAGQSNLAPLLQAVQSGDPAKVKAAQATAGMILAGKMGPDKFAETYKAIGEEGRANQQLPGQMALTTAQTAQANAAARKDQFLPVTNPEGGQDVLNIGGPPGAPGAAPATGNGAVPPPPPTSAAPAIPGPAGQIVTQTAQKVGATPDDMDYLARTAHLESRGDPNAQNGSSTGVFQMQPGTFAGVGGKDIGSVAQQTVAALRLKRQNAIALRGMLGHDATADQLYLAHQQGATGAAGLLSADPNANAIQALQAVGVSPAKAKASIINNGGTADMTAGQFVQKWRAAYQGGGAAGSVATDDEPQLGPGVTVAYKSKADGSTSLTPEAVDYIAQQYVATGNLPPLGMGKAATRNRDAVLNRAQQIEAETGATGQDAVARHAVMKTAAATLTQVSKTASMVSAAENTVSKNMDVVTGLAPKGGGPTGSPLLNAPIQALRKKGWGSSQVAAYDAAIGTVADEYAKVMTAANGTGGVTSDSARQEAYSRLSSAATIGQVQAVMTTMRQEMANRSASLAQERASQLAILSNRGATPAAGAPAPGGQPQPGAPPPQAANGYTGPQIATARQLAQNPNFRSTPLGEHGNAYAPRSHQEFDAIKTGKWFINPADGQIMQKSH